MICHDQHLDRRVVAQASSLIAAGHHVTLLALAFGPENEETVTPEGISLFRIGLNEIVPANPTYVAYTKRQRALNRLLKAACNFVALGRLFWAAGFRAASWVNRSIYRLLLLARYRNPRMADPLPFTSAFVGAGARFQADIVQVHDLPGLEGGVKLAQQWQVPLVYDAHELYPEQCSFSTAQRKLCSDAEARLILNAKLVFAVNESIAEEMAKRYGIPKPIPLLNAIDPPAGFSPQARHDLLRQKLTLPRERRILLFQGGFAPHRNLESLIQAMSLVKTSDVDLVLMGFGEFGERLKAKAQNLGLLNRRIYFLPAVPQSELLQHSASADMGIIPYPHVDLNSYYCTPNKLFEFIQAGLPILANDSPELRRFVEEEGFGLVRPLNTAKQIAEAIDATFASGDHAAWKQNLLSKHADFAWRRQETVYLGAILPLLEKQTLQILNGKAIA